MHSLCMSWFNFNMAHGTHTVIVSVHYCGVLCCLCLAALFIEELGQPTGSTTTTSSTCVVPTLHCYAVLLYFCQEHLSRGPLRYGAGLFIEELAGAINRINYNQNNSQLNALAGVLLLLDCFITL